MRSFFTFLFLMTGSSLFAQVQLLNSGTNNNIGQIEKTGNTIFIRGTHDYFAKCYDDCDSIIVLNLPGSGYFSSHLSVIDSQKLYVLTHKGFPHHAIVLKSGDGGYNWNFLWDTSDVLLQYIVMFDTINGLAMGSNNGYRTVDGGISWEREHRPLAAVAATGKYNDSTVCIGTSGGFCISDNMGKDWSCRNFVQASPQRFFFLSSDTIFAVSGGNHGNYFSYSIDNGYSWNHSTVPVRPFGIYFKNMDEGYILGTYWTVTPGIILKTIDRGQNWQVINTGFNSALSDMIFINDSIALISGGNGLLFRWNTNDTTFFTSVPEVGKSKDKVHVTPNPASNLQTLVIITGKPRQLDVKIYDTSGRMINKVYKGSTVPGEQTITHDVSGLGSGVYIYRIRLDDEVKHLRFVKY